MTNTTSAFAHVALSDFKQDLQSLLAAKGAVAQDLLTRAALVRTRTGESLASVLTRLGFISEQALAELIAEASGVSIASETDYAGAPQNDVPTVSSRFLRDVKAAPLKADATEVVVAFVDPFDDYARKALAMAYGRPVRPLIGLAGQIDAILDRLDGAATPAELDATQANELDLERLQDLASDAPAIRAVNRLISQAVEERASDIHFEPTESGLKVRFRVDGALVELDPLPSALRSAVISRVKVMAGLNIAEKRLPQDGRLRLTVRGHEIDLRAAVSPTIHGESVVLRLLDRSRLSLDFVSLGFDSSLIARLNQALAKPHGVMLVTGPTGSGKTTSLYAALALLNKPDRKLLTIEDPIEYRLTGVNQTQVNPSIELSFAAALRSFLRQDPDIIMVGEVRDLETAQIAIQAALTGHLILSTLHTNSASSAVTRLLDMGVEPFLITSTLHTILAQRLVRRLCPHCRKPAAPRQWKDDVNRAGATLAQEWRPIGCSACAGSGFLGRIALGELLMINDDIARLILERAEARQIETTAVRAGMVTLWRDGLSKVEQGLTTLEEVLRVAQEN